MNIYKAPNLVISPRRRCARLKTLSVPRLVGSSEMCIRDRAFTVYIERYNCTHGQNLYSVYQL